MHLLAISLTKREELKYLLNLNVLTLFSEETIFPKILLQIFNKHFKDSNLLEVDKTI